MSTVLFVYFMAGILAQSVRFLAMVYGCRSNNVILTYNTFKGTLSFILKEVILGTIIWPITVSLLIFIFTKKGQKFVKYCHEVTTNHYDISYELDD